MPKEKVGTILLQGKERKKRQKKEKEKRREISASKIGAMN
jgi:hypothetical protein